jgi:CarboxypepD_reg-like domain/TonB-dependent Receptor Plug Domain
MKKTTYLLIFNFISFLAIAQTVTIKGRVLDADTKEGLPSCNVFINNTTIGQSTNLDGFYQFSNVKLKDFDLVFRYVGFETTTRKITAKEGEVITLDIELKPSQNALTEVEVKSKRDKKWEKQLKSFKNSFFGYSDFAKKCEIENAWILDFNEEGENFEAKTNQTLKVLNPALGYIMYFDFKEFKVSKDAYRIATNVSFTEMAPPNKAKLEEWLNNRKLAYKKSPGYFFKVLAAEELNKNGYQLYAEKSGSSTIRTDNFQNELGKTIVAYDNKGIVGLGKLPGHKKIYVKDNLEIHNQNAKSEIKTYQDMDYAVSWMQVRGNYMYLDENGIMINSQDLTVSGDMDYLKVSGLLPLNFDATIDANEAYFLNFEKPTFAETVHLHTDRSAYYINDKIWFKAYLNYSGFAATDTTSKVLYVQLYDDNKRAIVSQKIEINDGYAYGQMTLPNNTNPGAYTLRAYTQYMQNFDKNMFQVAIPILAMDEIIKHDPEAEELIIDALEIEAMPNGENLTINIKNKAKKPIGANFSVSITNPEFSPSVGSTILKDLALPKQKVRQPFKYSMETGLIVEGVLMDKKKSPLKADFNVWTNSVLNMTEGSADENGNFKLNNLNFYGESDVFFKIKGKKNTESLVILKPKTLLPEFKHIDNVFEKEKIPEAVFEIDQKIAVDTAKTKKYEGKEVKMIYGRPDHTLLEKDIIKSNGIQGIVNSLTSKVPNLRYTPAGFIIRGGATTVNGSSTALMLIDGVPNNSFGTLDPNNIKKIEVLSRMSNMFGDQGKNGIVSFFLKNGEGIEDQILDRNTVKVSDVGYEMPQIFEYPSIKMKGNKNLPTIYWSPEILTDANGTAIIEMKMPPKPFRITIEGITQNNVSFRREFLVK